MRAGVVYRRFDAIRISDKNICMVDSTYLGDSLISNMDSFPGAFMQWNTLKWNGGNQGSKSPHGPELDCAVLK